MFTSPLFLFPSTTSCPCLICSRLDDFNNLLMKLLFIYFFVCFQFDSGHITFLCKILLWFQIHPWAWHVKLYTNLNFPMIPGSLSINPPFIPPSGDLLFLSKVWVLSGSLLFSICTCPTSPTLPDITVTLLSQIYLCTTPSIIHTPVLGNDLFFSFHSVCPDLRVWNLACFTLYYYFLHSQFISRFGFLFSLWYGL